MNEARTPWPAKQRPERVGEVRQALRGHGRVLHERRGALGAGRAHEQRQHRAAQRGSFGQRLWFAQPGEGRGAQLWSQQTQALQPVARLVFLALVLHGEHGRLGAGQQRRHAPEGGEVGGAAQRLQVEQLHGGWRGSQDGGRGLQGAAHRGERQRGAHARGGPRVQGHLHLGEQRQRALRARQQPRQTGLGRQQLTQVVAGRAAPRLGKAGGDGRTEAFADAGKGLRQTGGVRPAQAGAQVAAGWPCPGEAVRRRPARRRCSRCGPWTRRRRWNASRTSCWPPCRRWWPGPRSTCRGRTPDRSRPPRRSARPAPRPAARARGAPRRSTARMRSSLKQSTRMPGPMAWPATLLAAPRAARGRP